MKNINLDGKTKKAVHGLLEVYINSVYKNQQLNKIGIDGNSFINDIITIKGIDIGSFLSGLLELPEDDQGGFFYEATSHLISEDSKPTPEEVLKEIDNNITALLEGKTICYSAEGQRIIK
ncbi:hypothetical protein [Bacillus sp. FJAT-44742]|uniref:hypothetical protein n=1 Tax=Bacillus sp. FJAT-44742 TaxID=2014005 RepID=UPI000C2414E6|nr:hypothetical protein [Bacillus sp. FJAT-44742]